MRRERENPIRIPTPVSHSGAFAGRRAIIAPVIAKRPMKNDRAAITVSLILSKIYQLCTTDESSGAVFERRD